MAWMILIASDVIVLFVLVIVPTMILILILIVVVVNVLRREERAAVLQVDGALDDIGEVDIEVVMGIEIEIELIPISDKVIWIIVIVIRNAIVELVRIRL